METFAIDALKMKNSASLTKEQIELLKDELYTLTGLCFSLYNELGHGYSEPIYQECMKMMCEERGIPCEREKVLKMSFHGNVLEKEYKADLVCYNTIITEFKAVSELLDVHRAQLFNYLRITHSPCGLLVNFGEPRRLHAEKYIYSHQTDRYELVRS